MESKTIDLKEMRERMAKRKASADEKRKLFIENLSRKKFCEILDDLAPMFRFELMNICEDFDGYWEKIILGGKTVWRKGEEVLPSSSFFPFRKEVFDAIDKERNIYYKVGRNWRSIRGIKISDGTTQGVPRKKGDLTLILTKEKLKELYYKQNKSLEDIGKEYGCSRPHISKIMERYGLIRRTQSKARIEAIKKGKFETFEYHEINEKFFSEWSLGMAWVLGLLFTDGNINKGRVLISSVDIELLKNIKKLLNSSNPIPKRTQSYDKSKHIYDFGFSREKMKKDLNRLGLYEKKSLDMVFPDVPEEYMRHFIRGCWDGDGSVFLDKSKIVASYVSGSKKFIEKLVQELYKIGISKSGLSYKFGKSGKRIPIPPNHRDSRFPLTLFKDKRANAYYIKIRGKENIEKLFHYFYDGVDESMYLTRKYNVFVKGLKLGEKEETEQLTLDLDF